MIVGNNDIGKSTILEALDIFFNDKSAVNKISFDDLNHKSKLEGETTANITCLFKLKEDEQEPIIVCPEVNDACVTDELEEPLIPKEEETSEGATSTGKVSLNTATLEELQTLDGIGESKAQAIIDYRTQNGPFETIEQLKEVSGIGDSTFEKIKDKITT